MKGALAMNSIQETETERPRWRSFVSTLQRAAVVLALALCTALPSYAFSWYSGAAVGSDGTVYGWGVTDVTTYSMYHVAYVWVTLTSPKGRQCGPVYASWQNSARGDVALTFDPSDFGTYFVQSTNKGFCHAGGGWIVNGSSGAQTTVPYVTLTLRTGNNNTVSTDNDKREAYYQELNTYILGYFRSGGSADHVWRTAVEIVGQVTPNTYTGTFTFHRTIVAQRVYHDTVELTQYRKDNVADGVEPLLEDLNPQSGGSNGKIYDLDAPGFGSAPSDPPGYIYRKRVNFNQWVTLPDGVTQVSNNLLWYSRLSIVTSTNGDQAQQDIPNDNQAATGSTKITWNFQ
jgi:hypothetical protein